MTMTAHICLSRGHWPQFPWSPWSPGLPARKLKSKDRVRRPHRYLIITAVVCRAVVVHYDGVPGVTKEGEETGEACRYPVLIVCARRNLNVYARYLDAAKENVV